MMMKPQDILVLLKLSSLPLAEWSYQQLGEALCMSASEVHAALTRARASRLVDAEKKAVSRLSLLEFLIHGLKYMVPAVRGASTRGVPTGHAAPFLHDVFTVSDELPPVWPHPAGTVRGIAFSPLYRSAPDAALKDEALYRLLVLVDLIRGGNARERKWAEEQLRASLGEKS